MEFGLHTASENSRTKIYNFGGLNRTRKGNRYEFSDMYNMTADEYPCASPCGSRQKIAQAQTGINAVCAPDATNVSEVTGITGVYDGGFYYNGVLKSTKFTLSQEWSWQIKQKGNIYIINGYDKQNTKSSIYYYCIDTDEFDEGGKGMLNLILTSGKDGDGNFLRTPDCDYCGIDTYQCTTPDGTVIKNSDFWTEYRDYTTVNTSDYVTMAQYKNIFLEYFKIGDEITIENFPGTDNNGQLWNVQNGVVHPQRTLSAERNNTIDTDNMATTDGLNKYSICIARVTGIKTRAVTSNSYAHYIYFELYNKDGEQVDFVNLEGNSTGVVYCSGVTLKKRTRVLDNITIHHGRIWGSAPSGNQLYASASDNIFSFSSEDIVKKFAARIPSDTPGIFTALCSYNNDLIAFKPDSITIVSGTSPTNYTSFVIEGIGCISPGSVAVTPEGVLFLGYNGFYVYNGSVPKCISTKVNTKYTSAVAGYDGDSYYASAVTENGECELLVYNMNYGMWHKRDDITAKGFFRFHNSFYIADETSVYKTDSLIPGDWSFTLMPTHDNKFNSKGVNEIWVRAEVSEGAMFIVETAVDSGEFKTHTVFSEAGLKVYRCPVRLEMGEMYKVRISGTGKVVVYEVEIKKSDGGRRYKEY